MPVTAPALIEPAAQISLIDHRGRTNARSAGCGPDVPSYPAGTDPDTVRYEFARDHRPHTAAEIRTLSATCALGGGPESSPGLQPATAIKPAARARAALGCAEYRDFEGVHRGIHEVRVDGGFGYCETYGKTQFRCTVLLARGDLLSRLQIVGPTEQTTVELAAKVVPVVTAALVRAG